MQYRFEWNPQKAASNHVKHGIRFEQAATVFRDPHMLCIYDESHSESEDRWLTLGLPSTGPLLVVNHTFEKVDEETTLIRIISSRKASPREQAQYTERAT